MILQHKEKLSDDFPTVKAITLMKPSDKCPHGPSVQVDADKVWASIS